MKRVSRLLFLVVLLAVFSLAFAPLSPVLHVVTQDVQPFDQVLNIIMVIAVGFGSLIGVSQLVAIVVNLLKFTPLIKDGTSAKWAAALNLLAFVALVGFGVFKPDLALTVLDGYAGQLATIGLFVLGFITQMTSSKPAHDALTEAKVPVIGKTFK